MKSHSFLDQSHRANQNLLILSLLVTGLVSFYGCNEPGTQPPPERQPVITVETEPTKGPDKSLAQPKLKTVKIWLGDQELITEIARSFNEVKQGMMFRESMEENEAMIFVFPSPRSMGFWMRNTYVPLSCAYIDATGVIREVYDMEPLNEESISSEGDQLVYVLEVKQGWFERHEIGVGTQMMTEHGSLKETFLGNR
ncbi:MAG TPA: DUF192 domain-containing protein [Verrucomicrobiales bacterium]|nr:DUF192 domain-containing protein [Verrucomicrobiales bacterium]HIL70847.1 DUF192 domain-containing protein [Verrucomicrobiota bacterium]